MASIISADNDNYTEEVKQQIISRFNEHKQSNWEDYDWGYILEPIGDKNEISKIIELIR